MRSQKQMEKRERGRELWGKGRERSRATAHRWEKPQTSARAGSLLGLPHPCSLCGVPFGQQLQYDSEIPGKQENPGTRCLTHSPPLPAQGWLSRAWLIVHLQKRCPVHFAHSLSYPVPAQAQPGCGQLV